MPTMTPVDLSDSALWRNGFPDDLFTELRRERPIFHHELTEVSPRPSNAISG